MTPQNNKLPPEDPRQHPEDARATLHAEFTDIVRTEIGMNERFASDVAAAFLRGLCARVGGQEIYIPVEDRSERNATIRATFNGTNVDDICKRHGISRATVYRVVGEKP